MKNEISNTFFYKTIRTITGKYFFNRGFGLIKDSTLINNKKFGDTDLKLYQFNYSKIEFGANNEQP